MSVLQLRSFEGHGDFVWAIAVQGKSLFTASSECITRQWSLDTGEEVRCFQPAGTLVCLRFAVLCCGNCFSRSRSLFHRRRCWSRESRLVHRDHRESPLHRRLGGCRCEMGSHRRSCLEDLLRPRRMGHCCAGGRVPNPRPRALHRVC